MEEGRLVDCFYIRFHGGCGMQKHTKTNHGRGADGGTVNSEDHITVLFEQSTRGRNHQLSLVTIEFKDILGHPGFYFKFVSEGVWRVVLGIACM